MVARVDALQAQAMPGEPVTQVQTIEPAKRSIRLDAAELIRSRALLWTLAVGLMRIRYKQTWARGLWLIAVPTIQTAVFVFVFGHWARIPSEGVPFAPWVLSALIPWSFVSSALNAAVGSLIDNAGLLRKVRISKLVFPISSVLVVAVDMFVGLTLFYIVAAFYGVAHVPNLPILAWTTAMLLLLCSSVGAACACLAAIYRDFRILVPVSLQILFYASPIVYPVGLVPRAFWELYTLNPLVPLLDTTRAALLGHKPIELGPLTQASAACLAIALLSLAVFRVAERTLVDRI